MGVLQEYWHILLLCDFCVLYYLFFCPDENRYCRFQYQSFRFFFSINLTFHPLPLSSLDKKLYYHTKKVTEELWPMTPSTAICCLLKHPTAVSLLYWWSLQLYLNMNLTALPNCSSSVTWRRSICDQLSCLYPCRTQKYSQLLIFSLTHSVTSLGTEDSLSWALRLQVCCCTADSVGVPSRGS